MDEAIELAATQFAELEVISDGAVEVLAPPSDDGDNAGTFLVSIDTSVHTAGPGIRVRARERFRIVVSDTFPFEPPTVLVDHRRWATSRHVQWGRYLCLYAAPSIEWVPADGMRGLLDRLLTWLDRAAKGTLDPDGQPLHPPVAYPTATGCAIIHPNLGDRVPWSAGVGGRVVRLFAWCVRSDDRIDVLAWLTEEQLIGRANLNGGRSTDSQDKPYFVALTVVITDEIGWEYPREAAQLAENLSQAGYSREALLADLTWTNQANQVLRSRGANTDVSSDPVVMLLGTPSRRVAGDERLAHLVAWKLDRFGEGITTLLADGPRTFSRKTNERLHALARRWLRAADVRWMVVFDQRPEITRRRDNGTDVSWLRRTRVLVLGCGALGAPVAEYCVRAGATSVTVLDHGIVTPGVLVRQPYYDNDIGHFKAEALANRLNTVGRKPAVHDLVRNAVSFLLVEFDPAKFDLIVDATADSGVRAALERTRRTYRTLDVRWPPTVTVIIGHRADRGLLTVSQSGATGTGQDVLRRAVLRARRAELPGWKDVIADIFPDPPRTEMFFPEPGCSAPTFVGSAADVTALAASMVNEAVHALSEASAGGETMTAIAVRQSRATHGRHQAATESLAWPNDVVLTDPGTGYDVRISAEAMAEIRTEVRRGARVRGPRIETGGMLLGTIDESTGIVMVDLATGPSPDSKLSSNYFAHGTVGTQDLIDHHAHRTGDLAGFLGIWHTHPGGPAVPSQTDEDGMAALITFTGTARRALMMILGGTPQVWNEWTDTNGLPDINVRIVERDPIVTLADSPQTPDWTQEAPPPGQYFSGGFAAPPRKSSPRPRRRWLWWRRR